MLFGAFYFLDNSMIEHSREVINIIDIMAQFGGLTSGIMNAAFIFGFFINSRIHLETFIKENYFLKLSSKKKKGRLSECT